MDDRVLILGAGINGAAIARELALNGVGSTIVDVHDIASGATAYSSRLIHGGLRYLEYGEFDLVRESLEERTRWLRLAPQFVRPLRLFIPIRNRRGGLLAGARKFLGLKPRRGVAPAKHRGLWSIRVGLWLYDVYAHDPTLPRRRLYKSRSPKVVPVDSTKYRWMYSFSDAQIVYPERFTLAMLEDARQIAADQKIPFEVCTYHRAALEGDTVTVTPVDERGANPALEFKPAAIVNATGAWVDRTLAALHVPSKSLMGGTKGSHFITHHESLRNRLKGRAIYVEAADGRPVFVLPFGDATLVGTTDLPFTDDPAKAVATPEELQYLVDAVNDLFPDLRLTTGDISLHYSGVRPLPASGPATPAAVTRRHWLEPNDQCPIPMYSVIGGKLTTCRSLAEESAGIILARLGLEQKVNSRERPLPGGKEHPRDSGQLQSEWNRIAARFGPRALCCRGHLVTRRHAKRIHPRRRNSGPRLRRYLPVRNVLSAGIRALDDCQRVVYDLRRPRRAPADAALSSKPDEKVPRRVGAIAHRRRTIVIRRGGHRSRAHDRAFGKSLWKKG